MTDFLKELELQLTAAAHRKAAERARPPRPKLWPTVAFVSAAAVAIAAMFLLPGRPASRHEPAAKAVSLANLQIGVYNAAGATGLSLTATRVLQPDNQTAAAETVPSGRERKYSTVYFSRGYAAEAREVAKRLGIERVGSPPPAFGGANYDVVAVLGQDYARPATRLLDSFAFLREAINRTVQTAAGPVRVSANQAGLCLWVRDGGGWGGTCIGIDDALAGKAVVSLRQKNERLRSAVGFVPDGVGVVDLREADGTTRRLQVGRNLWAVGAEKVISVSFGGKTIPVP